MSSPTVVDSWVVTRPVSRVLGDGLRAALVDDPVGLVLVPLVFHFPNVALEAIQARYLTYVDDQLLRHPPIAFALSAGWAFALVGRLIGQALVVRRTARWLEHHESLPLDLELTGVMRVFPTFLVVSLLFMLAVVVGLVMLAVPALVAVTLWGFAGQAAALGGVGVLGAFGASRQAVRGKLLRWGGAALLVLGALVVLASGFGLIWTGLRELFTDEVPFLLFLGAAAAVELVSVVFTATWTALYLDLSGAGGRLVEPLPEPAPSH